MSLDVVAVAAAYAVIAIGESVVVDAVGVAVVVEEYAPENHAYYSPCC